MGWQRTVITDIWMILGLEGGGVLKSYRIWIGYMTLNRLELTLFGKLIVRRLFDTGFIVIRWILGCDLPMHKSGLGQNEAGVPFSVLKFQN